MITKTGLHHDISMSHIYYRQIKVRCVNKEAGVIAIEAPTVPAISLLNKTICLVENKNLQNNNMLLGHKHMFLMKANLSFGSLRREDLAQIPSSSS